VFGVTWWSDGRLIHEPLAEEEIPGAEKEAYVHGIFRGWDMPRTHLDECSESNEVAFL
jgi:hypothetical protein